MFKIYRGVQRPIMFKELKGRFIYIGGGVLAGSLVLLLILSKIIGIVLGFLSGIGIAFFGLFLVYKEQKKGLYKKTNDDNKIFIVKNRMKFKREDYEK